MPSTRADKYRRNKTNRKVRRETDCDLSALTERADALGVNYHIPEFVDRQTIGECRRRRALLEQLIARGERSWNGRLYDDVTSSSKWDVLKTMSKVGALYNPTAHASTQVMEAAYNRMPTVADYGNLFTANNRRNTRTRVSKHHRVVRTRVHYGPRGGMFYMRKGKKVYVKSTHRRRTKKR